MMGRQPFEAGIPARPLHGGRMLAVLLAAPFMAQADATIANAAAPPPAAALR